MLAFSTTSSACAGANVLILRAPRDTAYQKRERVPMQQGVGVDGHQERSRHALEGGVEGVVLAGDRFEHVPIVEAVPPRRPLRELGGAIGRVVISEYDLNRALISESGDVVHGGHDRVLLIPRGHDHRHGGPLSRRPWAPGRIRGWDAVADREQGEGEEADHDRRDVGEHDRDDPRHDGPDCFAKVGPPGRREVHTEGHVRDREAERDGETNRRASAGPGAAPPRHTAKPRSWGRKLLRHGTKVPTETTSSACARQKS